MRQFKKTKLLTFILISLCLTSFAQGRNELYDFPIKPGTEKWKQLQTHQEMVLSCQISNEKLLLLSTSTLISACLKYPLAFDIFAYDNLKNGFSTCFGKFNGFHELLNRPDAGRETMSSFMRMDLADINSLETDIDKGNFTFSSTITEMLLSQQKILNQLNEDQQILILKKVIENRNIKTKHKVHFGTLGEYSLAYLAGNILSQNNIEISKDERKFVADMVLKDENVIVQIFDKVETVITKK